MAIDLYSPLRNQIHRVAGCGIVRGEVVMAGTDEKPGFIVVLRANANLWARIQLAPRFTYPEHVIDAIGVMSRPIMQFVRNKQIHLTPSEPLAIATATVADLCNSGVVLDNGTYTVPDAMLGDEKTYNRMLEPTTPAAFWACELNRYECFDADNPRHRNFISFVVLPDRTASMEECSRGVLVSDPGWNWALGMSPTDFSHVAAQLHRNQAHAGPLGV